MQSTSSNTDVQHDLNRKCVKMYCKRDAVTKQGRYLKKCQYHLEIERKSKRKAEPKQLSNKNPFQIHTISTPSQQLQVWKIGIPGTLLGDIGPELDLALHTITRRTVANPPSIALYTGHMSRGFRAFVYQAKEEDRKDMDDAMTGFLPEFSNGEWTDDYSLEVQAPKNEYISLGQMKRHIRDEDKVYNCLAIPGGGIEGPEDADETFMNEFKHDLLAEQEVVRMCRDKTWREGRDGLGSKHADDILKVLDHPTIRGLLKHLESFRLLATAGSLTNMHVDGGGCLTMLKVIFGAKLWTIYKVDDETGPCEHMVLQSGDMLMMVPDVIHTVYGPQSCGIKGRHYLHYDFLFDTATACITQGRGSDSTNEYLPVVQIKLLLMAIALESPTFCETLNLARHQIISYTTHLKTIMDWFSDMFPDTRSPAQKKSKGTHRALTLDQIHWQAVNEGLEVLRPIAFGCLDRTIRRIMMNDFTNPNDSM